MASRPPPAESEDPTADVIALEKPDATHPPADRSEKHPAQALPSTSESSKFPLEALPLELQMHVFSYLSLLDFRRLRRTNHFYHSLVTASFIRACIPPRVLEELQLSVCGRCLKFHDLRDRLLWRSGEELTQGLKARCQGCLAIEGLTSPSDLVWHYAHELDDGTWSRMCRLCGRPTWDVTMFHSQCDWKYWYHVRRYYYLVATRTLLTLVSVSIALRYYKSELIVFIPCLLMFPLLAILCLFTFYRGLVTRTYHFTGILELLLLGIFIPPTYFFAKQVGKKREKVPSGMNEALLVLFAINSLIRFLNSLGSVVLFFEYDRTMLSWPEPTRLRRSMNAILTALIFWTYPRFLEAEYIGRNHNTEEKSLGHKIHAYWLNLKEVADSSSTTGSSTAGSSSSSDSEEA